MSLKGKTLFAAAVAQAVLVGLSGCGSSTTNNDQGTALLATGFFTDSTGKTGEEEIPVELSSDLLPGDDIGQNNVAYIGVENRLRNEFVQLTKVDCDYVVPGSTLPIPPDSAAISGVIPAAPGIGGAQIGISSGSGGVGFTSGGGAASSATSSASTSSSTGGSTASTPSSGSGPATGTGSTEFAGFELISPDIFAYLNNNRLALPELPFRMFADCSATGVTSAGDVIETNQVGMTINFFEKAPAAPTAAPSSTSGTDSTTNSSTTTVGTGTKTSTGG